METLIKLLDPNLECSDMIIENQTVTFYAHSLVTHATCPYCRTSSKRVHAKYIHQIQDISIQSMTVSIFLTTRRFCCDHSDCLYQMFAETFSFIQPHAKKTTRLLKQITDIALTQSSLSATHQLHDLGVIVEKSSICNYLKKNLSCNERSDN